MCSTWLSTCWLNLVGHCVRSRHASLLLACVTPQVQPLRGIPCRGSFSRRRSTCTTTTSPSRSSQASPGARLPCSGSPVVHAVANSSRTCTRADCLRIGASAEHASFEEPACAAPDLGMCLDDLAPEVFALVDADGPLFLRQHKRVGDKHMRRKRRNLQWRRLLPVLALSPNKSIESCTKGLRPVMLFVEYFERMGRIRAQVERSCSTTVLLEDLCPKTYKPALSTSVGYPHFHEPEMPGADHTVGFAAIRCDTANNCSALSRPQNEKGKRRARSNRHIGREADVLARQWCRSGRREAGTRWRPTRTAKPTNMWNQGGRTRGTTRPILGNTKTKRPS